MVEEKKETTKTKTPTKKKTKKSALIEDVEKFSISELLVKNQIKPLYAIGFLEYYGLSEEFKMEMETKEKVTEFSEKEFNDMYEQYIKREI